MNRRIKKQIKDLLGEVVTAKRGFAVTIQDILENPEQYDGEEIVTTSFFMANRLLRIVDSIANILPEDSRKIDKLFKK